MAVLSDKTIKDRIKRNELIPGGDPAGATHCSYEFTAASILQGGSHEAKEVTESGVVIKPAQLVWIRAREDISMPANTVGLWIQTQKLARQGLLLLNISLIEPGYEGPLTAVLVNFGKNKVVIRQDTKIAKIVFLTLDSATDKLVGKWDPKAYDTELMDMAVNAPASFLQLESFLPNIEERANARLMAMDKEIELNIGNIANEAKFKLEQELGEKMKSSFIRGHIGLFGSFIVVLGAFLFVITTFLPRLAAEYSGVEELARKAVMAQQAETIAGLTTRLDNQATEIESLKKIFSVKVGDNKPQRQDDPSDTTRLTTPDNTVPKQ